VQGRRGVARLDVGAAAEAAEAGARVQVKTGG